MVSVITGKIEREEGLRGGEESSLTEEQKQVRQRRRERSGGIINANKTFNIQQITFYI